MKTLGKGSIVHGRETHDMAQTPATENLLLQARIERERALAGLFNTLRDVALDLRELIRKEASK